MGKRRFRKFPRERRGFTAPITEGRAEAVNRRAINLQSVHYFGHRHMSQRLSTARARKNVIASLGVAELFEDRERARSQGNAMLPGRFHSRRWQGPDLRLHVDFRPSRAMRN